MGRHCYWIQSLCKHQVHGRTQGMVWSLYKRKRCGLTCLTYNNSRGTHPRTRKKRHISSNEMFKKNVTVQRFCLPCLSFSSIWEGRQRSPAS